MPYLLAVCAFFIALTLVIQPVYAQATSQFGSKVLTQGRGHV
jgi:hypothetical protein